MWQYLFLALAVSAEVSRPVHDTGKSDVGVLAMDLCAGGPGTACDNTCQKLGVCLDTGNGLTWKETLDCGSLHCDPGTAECSTTTSCVPNSGTIGCDANGVFPDPYDCKRYLTCKKGGLAVQAGVCPDFRKYDACTNKCDAYLPNNICPSVSPICKKPGQVSLIEENQRMFFYCAEDTTHLLHPVINICDFGFFNLTLEKCEASAAVGCKPVL